MTYLDASDHGAATVPMDGGALAQFQMDYQNTLKGGDFRIVKVADNQQTGGPADRVAQAAQAAPDSADEKIGVKEIVAADPKDLSPNLQTLQGLAGHFDKADDKVKAMAEVKGEVEKTITAADAAQAAAEKAFESEAVTLKPKYEAAGAAIKAAQGPLQDAIKKIPEDDREHVGGELTLLSDDKTSPALRKALEADLAGYPGLVDAANKFIAAGKAAEPIMEQVKASEEKMAAAAEDPVVARLVYADMLEQSGDKAGAKQAQGEAMGLQMGLSIDKIHQMQEQQKQLQQKH